MPVQATKRMSSSKPSDDVLSATQPSLTCTVQSSALALPNERMLLLLLLLVTGPCHSVAEIQEKKDALELSACQSMYSKSVIGVNKRRFALPIGHQMITLVQP